MNFKIGKICNFILFVILLINLTGCYYSKEEKKIVKEYERQAKINALDYIKEKYGIDAKVVSVTAAHTTNSFLPIPDYTPTGYAYVKLKVGKKKFYVYITGESYSVDGIDSYQQKEIENDLIELLRNNIGKEHYRYFISYSKDDIYYNTDNSNLIKEYYDKNNLNDVVKNIGWLELYYINYSDLDTVDLSNVLEDVSNINIKLINFKTFDDYEGYIHETLNKKHGCQLSCDDRFYIYKSNELIVKNGIVEYYNYNKSSYNNEVYIYSNGIENINIKMDNSDFALEKVKNVMYEEEYHEFKNKKIKQIYDVYSIVPSSSNLFIYFPIYKNFKYVDSNQLVFAFKCYKDGEEFYSFDTYINKRVYTKYYYYEHNFSNCDLDKNVNFTLLKVSD